MMKILGSKNHGSNRKAEPIKIREAKEAKARRKLIVAPKSQRMLRAHASPLGDWRTHPGLGGTAPASFLGVFLIGKSLANSLATKGISIVIQR